MQAQAEGDRDAGLAYQMRMGQRRFLFLQGPHGPFFAGLAARLRDAGAEVWRVGFNAGDAGLWRGPGYLAFRQRPEDWPDWLENLLDEREITDLVCYGATRPIHRAALEIARAKGMTAHLFEEGYLRPYWVTYERGGTNAASHAASLPLDRMAAALSGAATMLTEAPDRWGDMRAHIFWGAVYHGLLLAGRRWYQTYRPHRTPGVEREFRLHLAKVLEMPFRTAARRVATTRIRFGGFPYHVVLLQLAHDANFRDNGPFASQAEFLEPVFRGFAEGAPRHHHLVLKAHPLEDGREPLRPLIRHLARRHGLGDRVHFVTGGKLARLLDAAKSAITVNSTSAEQALWRGLPLKAFGDAVYNRSEFVSNQSVAAFFRDPRLPDRDAYLTYRRFQLATSQVPGGFYSIRGRRKLMRQLPDLLLASRSPTERLLAGSATDAAASQHLQLVL